MNKQEGIVIPQDAATQMTVGMYDRIPRTFAGHFAGFAKNLAEWDSFGAAHEIAGVPMGEGQTVEIGCGDGRDAESTFVPGSASYVGFEPSTGLLNLARERFAGADPAKVRFEQGYAQTSDYPEGTDIAMAVNSILHVPKSDLPAAFDRVREGLREGGVFYAITKTDPTDDVEVYHDDFEGENGERVVGERKFYHHSVETLTGVAEKAGFVVVRNQITPVEPKPWDWLQFAAVKA